LTKIGVGPQQFQLAGDRVKRWLNVVRAQGDLKLFQSLQGRQGPGRGKCDRGLRYAVCASGAGQLLCRRSRLYRSTRRRRLPVWIGVRSGCCCRLCRRLRKGDGAQAVPPRPSLSRQKTRPSVVSTRAEPDHEGVSMYSFLENSHAPRWTVSFAFVRLFVVLIDNQLAAVGRCGSFHTPRSRPQHDAVPCRVPSAVKRSGISVCSSAESGSPASRIQTVNSPRRLRLFGE